MPLQIGARLGPYEILGPLGAGGMGEVYRATDTKLKRAVAIKVLPELVASDAERLARFQREAEVLASLNHPNIAAIYGLEDTDGIKALVMELVEGPTLADQIIKGPIPIGEALPIAKQIAEALEAAHGQGIIHRDLKPANIKVREDGTVKVLDFGLAKLVDLAAVVSNSNPSVTASPTITTPAMMTGVGVILGTAAYMSPEQAKGRPADKRSDVWAFGCVVYEMLTGRRAFEGDDVGDTLAAVLRAEPDWTVLPEGIPSTIRILLDRCLVKDRAHRITDVAVAKFLLNEPSAPRPPEAVATIQRTSRQIWAATATAMLVGAAIAAGTAWTLRPSTRVAPVGRFYFVLPEGQSFTNTTRQLVAISPDGTQIVYVANFRLYLRALSDLQARVIPGTEIAEGITNPVFSPDGRSIVFQSGADSTLKRIPVSGGTPVTICSSQQAPYGLSWGAEGIVIGGGARGILRVSENGGAPEQLVSVKQGELAAEPQVLPGGETVLFTLLSDTAGPRVDDRWDRAKVVVQSLKTGQRTSIVESGSDARYLPTGHLVYVLGGTVFAVPFDRRGLKITGVPVPVLEGVRRDTSGATGVAQFSLSDTGSLIFIPGPATLAGSTRTLILADRAGTTPVPIPSGTYTHPRVSRDGKLVAVEKDDGQEANVWIYDLSTATSNLRRLTFGGHNRLPVWSGDGQRVAFQSDRDGDAAIFAQRADGSGAVERLTKAESGVAHMPESWSPDGRTVLFSARKDATFSSWALSLIDKTAQRFGNVQSAEPIGATFSPDGHWVAYSTNDMPGGALSPNRGVYVQPFPATGVRYQVPKDSRDFHPAWGATEHQLFYAPSAGRLAVVNMQTQPTVTFGRPASVPSSAMESRLSTNVRDYDVMPDGRVLTIASGNIDQSSGRIGGQVQVVLNWTEELKQRVPTK